MAASERPCRATENVIKISRCGPDAHGTRRPTSSDARCRLDSILEFQKHAAHATSVERFVEQLAASWAAQQSRSVSVAQRSSLRMPNPIAPTTCCSHSWCKSRQRTRPRRVGGHRSIHLRKCALRAPHRQCGKTRQEWPRCLRCHKRNSLESALTNTSGKLKLATCATLSLRRPR